MISSNSVERPTGTTKAKPISNTVRPSRLRAARGYLAGHLGVGGALAVITFMSGSIGDRVVLTELLTWTVVSLSGWCLLSWSRASGSTFNLYGLFLWSMLAFHVGQFFLFAIGQLPILFAGVLPAATVDSMLLIIGWNLFALHLGALAAYALRQRGDSRPKSPRPRSSAASVRYMGFAMVLLGLPTTVILFVSRASVVGAAGYLGLYSESQAAGPLVSVYQNLAGLFVPGCLFILAGSTGRWRPITFAIVGITLSCVTSLALGYRAVALIPLLAMLWAWETGHRRVPRWVLILGTLTALFVVIPAVQFTRNLTTAARYDYLSGFSAQNNVLTSALSEMGGSAATVGYTYELVPQHRGYDLGVSYLSSLALIVPNVSTWQQDALQRANYDKWLIGFVDPVTAATGGSIGFSVVAEGYANFGWLGAAVLLALGFAIAQMHTRNETYSPLRVAAIATVMTVLLFLPRGEFVFAARPLFLYVVVPCVLIVMFHSGRLRRRGRPNGGEARVAEATQTVGMKIGKADHARSARAVLSRDDGSGID